MCRNPKDVDILMGTFTKSFGAMGGYIAGSKELIAAIRASSAGFLADNAMAPIVCQQILAAFRVIKGEDGTDIGLRKIARLHDNANYFREKLTALGGEVLGDPDSPVIPMMLYQPTKISAFSRECLKRQVRACPRVRRRVLTCSSDPLLVLCAHAACGGRRRLSRHARASSPHALLRIRGAHARRPGSRVGCHHAVV